MSAVVLIHPRRQGKTLERQAAERRIAARGYHALYRLDEVNHCPGCGRVNWHVGRFSAECAFCATSLPFATAASGKDL